jgi:hypothetical protein
MVRSTIHIPRLLLVCAVLASGGAVLAGAASADTPPIFNFNFCATQAPNATASLPYPGSFQVSSSDTSYSGQLCPRYVVDATVAATPWGWATVGARPNIKLSPSICNALHVRVSVYGRPLLSPGLVLLQSGSFDGHTGQDPLWGPGCYLQQTSGQPFGTSGIGDASATYTASPGWATTWRVTASATLDTIYGSLPIPVTIFGSSDESPK